MYRPSSVVSVSSWTLSAMTMPITSRRPRTVARYGVVFAMCRYYPTSCRPGGAALRTAPRRSSGGDPRRPPGRCDASGRPRRAQAADDVGNVWRDDEPVSPHLPTPLARRSGRLAEDLFEGEALAAGR